MVLAPAVTIVRLSLHVVAAAVWVGGQFTLAGMVPAARAADPSVVPALARRFAQLAWPAYLLLLATGIWNVAAVHPSRQSNAWQAVLDVKLAVVVVSGLAAFLHQRAASRPAIAAWGAVSGLAAPVALVLGVALAG